MDAVRQATKRDYEELVRLGNLCFTTPYNQYGVIEQRWCHVWGGHLKAPSDRYMKNFFLVERHGRIIGMLAIIPMVLECHQSQISVGGITAVATHPDYRNSGVMSTLMSFAEETMHTESYVASVLGGDRRRYGHFGWENVGLRGDVRFAQSYLQSIPESPVSAIQIHPEDDNYLNQLVQMGSQGKTKFSRSKDQLRVLMRRPRVEFWALAHGGKLSSYVGAIDEAIWEYVGVPQEIPPLVRYFGLIHGYREVSVATPAVFGPHEEELYGWASSLQFRPMVFLKILRFRELVEKLLPGFRDNVIRKVIPDFRATLVIQETNETVTLTVADHEVNLGDEQSDNTIRLSRRSMARVLFGPCSEGVLMEPKRESQLLKETLRLDLSFSWIDMV